MRIDSIASTLSDLAQRGGAFVTYYLVIYTLFSLPLLQLRRPDLPPGCANRRVLSA